MGLEKPAKQVITVGGTNGKGSTVAFIESIARAAGWKTGAYTSPHLLRYNERVRIDGVEVGDAALVDAFEIVEAARISPSPNGRGVGVRGNEGQDSPSDTDCVRPSSAPTGQALLPLGEGDNEIPLTYFEYGTLAALWLFQCANLDLAVHEVGLGGRLDAVNIVDADVAVITTVDIDHTDLLGNDRESIGHEKAGIARAWKPLVLGEVDSPSSVLRHAYAIGANALRLGSDFFAEPINATHWRWREVGTELELPNPSLPAPAQRNNAAAAIAALRALPVSPSDSAFAQGIAGAKLPGRLQHFSRNGVDVFVDVGHNPQAARELAAWLALQSHTGRNFAIYAALADKDAAQVIGALGGAVTRWFLAGIDDAGQRSQSVDALAAKLANTVAAEGEHHVDVTQALNAALAQAQAGDRVLVFGSFHTAAAALVHL
jgi:dihydrofolate synthase/folylpolyglutamate synthase